MLMDREYQPASKLGSFACSNVIVRAQLLKRSEAGGRAHTHTHHDCQTLAQVAARLSLIASERASRLHCHQIKSKSNRLADSKPPSLTGTRAHEASPLHARAQCHSVITKSTAQLGERTGAILERRSLSLAGCVWLTSSSRLEAKFIGMSRVGRPPAQRESESKRDPHTQAKTPEHTDRLLWRRNAPFHALNAPTCG